MLLKGSSLRTFCVELLRGLLAVDTLKNAASAVGESLLIVIHSASQGPWVKLPGCIYSDCWCLSLR